MHFRVVGSLKSLLRDLYKMRDSDNEAGLNNALVADGLTGRSRAECTCIVRCLALAINSRKGFLHTVQPGGLLVITQKWSFLLEWWVCELLYSLS